MVHKCIITPMQKTISITDGVGRHAEGGTRKPLSLSQKVRENPSIPKRLLECSVRDVSDSPLGALGSSCWIPSGAKLSLSPRRFPLITAVVVISKTLTGRDVIVVVSEHQLDPPC